MIKHICNHYDYMLKKILYIKYKCYSVEYYTVFLVVLELLLDY